MFTDVFSVPEERPQDNGGDNFTTSITKKSRPPVQPYDTAWVSDCIAHRKPELAESLIRDLNLRAHCPWVVTFWGLIIKDFKASIEFLSRRDGKVLQPSTIVEHVKAFNKIAAPIVGFELRIVGNLVLRADLDVEYRKRQEAIARRKADSLGVNVRNLLKLQHAGLLAGNPEYAKGISALNDLKLLAEGK